MSKSKFRTQYDHKEVFSNPGSQYVLTYKPVYTDEGALDLVVDGKIDVYEQIQSFKESCELESILKRFQNGDVNALNQRLPYFADVTEMPDTLAGFLKLYQDAENTFAKLPADLRSQFNNSASEFFASAGSDRFNKLMGIGVSVESIEPAAAPITEKGEE